MRKLFTTVFFLAVVILAVAFTYRNQQTVLVDYLFGQGDVSLPWLTLVAILGGWALGLLSMLGVVIRLMAERRRLRRATELAEQEVENLRNIPIRDAH